LSWRGHSLYTIGILLQKVTSHESCSRPVRRRLTSPWDGSGFCARESACRAVRAEQRHAHRLGGAQLAKEAALSRSVFFERFSRAVGVAPIEYLLAWRMALAKNLLRRKEAGIAEVAERVGYSSASTFSVAFTRHVGVPPARYAREQKADEMFLPETATVM